MADPQDVVAQFVAITDCDPAQAEQYLDVSAKIRSEIGRFGVEDLTSCLDGNDRRTTGT